MVYFENYFTINKLVKFVTGQSYFVFFFLNFYMNDISATFGSQVINIIKEQFNVPKLYYGT